MAHFTCLELCCYGIGLGVSIVRFNQSEHSIWTISTNESAPLCLDWRETVGGPGGEAVWARHVPVSQSDQVDGVGGGLSRTTTIINYI